MIETGYEAEILDSGLYKIFKGVYNDFKSKAVSEYKFELEPLEYEEFIDAVEKGYLKCIVLKEHNIPTAFLVYTTSISESIELNIVHCLGNEDEIMILIDFKNNKNLFRSPCKSPITYALLILENLPKLMFCICFNNLFNSIIDYMIIQSLLLLK